MNSSTNNKNRRIDLLKVEIQSLDMINLNDDNKNCCFHLQKLVMYVQ